MLPSIVVKVTEGFMVVGRGFAVGLDCPGETGDSVGIKDVVMVLERTGVLVMLGAVTVTTLPPLDVEPPPRRLSEGLRQSTSVQT